MPECSTCRFCCWSFNVHDIPDEVQGLEFKQSFKHCQHECAAGCDLYGTSLLPDTCREFRCPYLDGAETHRPDSFQELLKELAGNIGNYIPAVPVEIKAEDALELIRQTRSIPAFIFINGDWEKVILPLNKDERGHWEATEDMIQAWNSEQITI